MSEVVRSSRGTFLPGSVGNPRGRPSLQHEQAVADLFHTAVSIEDYEAIILKAVEQAKAGNVKSRDWLFNRKLGRATEHVILDAVGPQEVILKLPGVTMPPSRQLEDGDHDE